ncbi:Lsr2 family protein [Galactobacter valiniphilus]|uniref:Lsr2 family protein n=1 Tax=Galactobacter valiniphilus TaxID=2676122 RepID=A0A399JD77_9MICC|nr:Lsr2 family protein [Galactobacter valiniphilus]RII42517.1 Lsr2 family protein [Galactobacter valiniphilus]
MAEIQTTTLIDDLTGKPLDAEKAHRIHFSVEGKTYRLDVDEKGADEFHAALDRFIEVSTKVAAGGASKRAAAAPRRASAGSGEQTKMREWAKANGYEVAERGRIPAAIQEAYAAAN